MPYSTLYRPRIRTLAAVLAALLFFSCILLPPAKRAHADGGFCTAVVTANKLNLRKGPSTDRSIVAVLQKGVVLDVLGISGDWLQVQLPSGTPSGYVLAEHVAVRGLPDNAIGIGVATGNVRLRTGVGTAYPSLGTIPRGTALIVLEKASSSWYRVRRTDTGKEGCMSGAYLSIVAKAEKGSTAPAPTGTTATIKGSGVNIRKGPSTSYSSLGKLANGTQLTVLSQNQEWYRVYVPSKTLYGYVHRLYVRFSAIPDENAVQGTVTGSGVNIRKGASTTYQSLGKLQKGTAVTILDTAGNWYKVQVLSTGVTGYVYQKYVSGQ